MSGFSSFGRQMIVAIRAMIVFTLLLGFLYPVAVWAVGQTAFHAKANGSPLAVGSRVIGSSLIGQSFVDGKGDPLPQWFQPRPSASNYNTLASGGSNLGPNNTTLLQQVETRRAQVAASLGVSPSSVPPDAVTASWSALDPDISPAYAYLQVNRVAKARHLSVQQVHALVASHIQSRTLGFLGEPYVNVLQLNVALQALR